MYTVDQVNMYSTIVAVILIYSILLSYVVITYREDFIETFCPRKKSVHDKNGLKIE